MLFLTVHPDVSKSGLAAKRLNKSGEGFKKTMSLQKALYF
jgi:hypothetical protein